MTFDFAPKLVIMIGLGTNGNITNYIFNVRTVNQNSYMQFAVLMDAVSTEPKLFCGFIATPQQNGASNSYGYKSQDGKTLYWYNAVNESFQGNGSSYSYYLIAIG